MVNRCVACKQICGKGSGKSIHRMPWDITRRKLWMVNLKLRTLKSSKWLYVCSDHFCDEDFIVRSGKKILKTEAVPSRISEHLPKSKCTASDEGPIALKTADAVKVSGSPTLSDSDLSKTLTASDLSSTLTASESSCTLTASEISCTLTASEISCTLTASETSCTLPASELSHTLTASGLSTVSVHSDVFDDEEFRVPLPTTSCSTWVAVGDIASTSQLPSPHGGHSNAASHHAQTSTPPPPVFTAADFIRSVNKKVRQNYIKRRLLTTYKALERLSQSEFNLDRLEVAPSTAAASIATADCGHSAHVGSSSRLTVPGASPVLKPPTPTNSTDAAMLRIAKQKASKNLPLTIRDVERERGKPLSKYERNMMVFNWLHTLDDNAVPVEGVQ